MLYKSVDFGCTNVCDHPAKDGHPEQVEGSPYLPCQAPPPRLRPCSAAALRSSLATPYLVSFHTVPHSWASPKTLSLAFSTPSTLFAAKHPGWVPRNSTYIRKGPRFLGAVIHHEHSTRSSPRSLFLSLPSRPPVPSSLHRPALRPLSATSQRAKGSRRSH